MVTTTIYKGIILPDVGGSSGIWGTIQNSNTFASFDTNIGGYATISLTNVNVTLNASQESMAILRIIGTLTGDVVITSACQGFKYVENMTNGAFTVSFSTGVGTPLVLAQYSSSVVIADATNGPRIAAGSEFPGKIVIDAGIVPPPGWILCYGQEISRTTYADLFYRVATTYGIGNGSTTFNVPDARGRTIFGLDNMGGVAAGRLTGGISGNITSGITLGSSGGQENHTVTTAEMPVHAHGVTDPTHWHLYYTKSSTTQYGGSGGGSWNGSTGAYTYASSTGISIQNTGGGSAHNTTPPAIVMNVIIKT